MQCVTLDAPISSASVDHTADTLVCAHGSTVSFYNAAEYQLCAIYLNASSWFCSLAPIKSFKTSCAAHAAALHPDRRVFAWGGADFALHVVDYTTLTQTGGMDMRAAHNSRRQRSTRATLGRCTACSTRRTVRCTPPDPRTERSGTDGAIAHHATAGPTLADARGQGVRAVEGGQGRVAARRTRLTIAARGSRRGCSDRIDVRRQGGAVVRLGIDLAAAAFSSKDGERSPDRDLHRAREHCRHQILCVRATLHELIGSAVNNFFWRRGPVIADLRWNTWMA